MGAFCINGFVTEVLSEKSNIANNKYEKKKKSYLLCAVLCCAILYYTILYYTILYYTILYYTILYYTILYYAKWSKYINILDCFVDMYGLLGHTTL